MPSIILALCLTQYHDHRYFIPTSPIDRECIGLPPAQAKAPCTTANSSKFPETRDFYSQVDARHFDDAVTPLFLRDQLPSLDAQCSRDNRQLRQRDIAALPLEPRCGGNVDFGTELLDGESGLLSQGANAGADRASEGCGVWKGFARHVGSLADGFEQCLGQVISHCDFLHRREPNRPITLSEFSRLSTASGVLLSSSASATMARTNSLSCCFILEPAPRTCTPISLSRLATVDLHVPNRSAISWTVLPLAYSVFAASTCASSRPGPAPRASRNFIPQSLVARQRLFLVTPSNSAISGRDFPSAASASICGRNALIFALAMAVSPLMEKARPTGGRMVTAGPRLLGAECGSRHSRWDSEYHASIEIDRAVVRHNIAGHVFATQAQQIIDRKQSLWLLCVTLVSSELLCCECDFAKGRCVFVVADDVGRGLHCNISELTCSGQCCCPAQCRAHSSRHALILPTIGTIATAILPNSGNISEAFDDAVTPFQLHDHRLLFRSAGQWSDYAGVYAIPFVQNGRQSVWFYREFSPNSRVPVACEPVRLASVFEDLGPFSPRAKFSSQAKFEANCCGESPEMQSASHSVGRKAEVGSSPTSSSTLSAKKEPTASDGREHDRRLDLDLVINGLDWHGSGLLEVSERFSKKHLEQSGLAGVDSTPAPPRESNQSEPKPLPQGPGNGRSLAFFCAVVIVKVLAVYPWRFA